MEDPELSDVAIAEFEAARPEQVFLSVPRGLNTHVTRACNAEH